MSTGKRALRYTSEAAMPERLRNMVSKQDQAEADRRARALADLAPQTVGMCTLLQPEEEAKNRERSVLAHKTTAIGPTTFTPPAKNKYGAVATVVDGIRFDSKREARYYEQLKLRRAAGEVVYWLRQAPIHLPGGTRLVIDFLEFHADGSVHYIDVKGRETPAFKIKRREIEAVYPIRIELA